MVGLVIRHIAGQCRRQLERHIVADVVVGHILPVAGRARAVIGVLYLLFEGGLRGRFVGVIEGQSVLGRFANLVGRRDNQRSVLIGVGDRHRNGILGLVQRVAIDVLARLLQGVDVRIIPHIIQRVIERRQGDALTAVLDGQFRCHIGGAIRLLQRRAVFRRQREVELFTGARRRIVHRLGRGQFNAARSGVGVYELDGSLGKLVGLGRAVGIILVVGNRRSPQTALAIVRTHNHLGVDILGAARLVLGHTLNGFRIPGFGNLVDVGLACVGAGVVQRREADRGVLRRAVANRQRSLVIAVTIVILQRRVACHRFQLELEFVGIQVAAIQVLGNANGCVGRTRDGVGVGDGQAVLIAILYGLDGEAVVIGAVADDDGDHGRGIIVGDAVLHFIGRVAWHILLDLKGIGARLAELNRVKLRGLTGLGRGGGRRGRHGHASLFVFLGQREGEPFGRPRFIISRAVVFQRFGDLQLFADRCGDLGVRHSDLIVAGHGANLRSERAGNRHFLHAISNHARAILGRQACELVGRFVLGQGQRLTIDILGFFIADLFGQLD